MIALISIPHQLPPKIHWYDSRHDLENYAYDYAINTGRDIPESFYDAVYCLADDWNSHLLIESKDDLKCVENYKGHQQLKITGRILKELKQEFLK